MLGGVVEGECGSAGLGVAIWKGRWMHGCKL